MRSFLLLSAILLQTGTAPLPINENDWSDYLTFEEGEKTLDNTIFMGIREWELPDGRRVDILTTKVAYEVDWVKKWPEGVGQALGYAIATNKDPGLVLLIKKGEDEYFNAALTVITDLRRRGYNFHFTVVNVENGKIWKL